MKSLFFTLAIVVSGSAYATGGFDCQYSKHNIIFNISGVTSWSFENAIVDASGSVRGEIGDDGVIHKFDYLLSKQDIVQYWNSNNQLNMVVYSENAKSEPIKAIIKTVSVDGITFDGTLRLSSGAQWSIEDKITCSVE